MAKALIAKKTTVSDWKYGRDVGPSSPLCVSARGLSNSHFKFVQSQVITKNVSWWQSTLTFHYLKAGLLVCGFKTHTETKSKSFLGGGGTFRLFEARGCSKTHPLEWIKIKTVKTAESWFWSVFEISWEIRVRPICAEVCFQSCSFVDLIWTLLDIFLSQMYLVAE